MPGFAARQRVSLAQLTVSGSTPVEVVRAAAAGGFDATGLRLEARMPDEQVGTPATQSMAELAAIDAEGRAGGVAVSNVTGRYLLPSTTRDDVRRLVDAGARLGARYVVAVCYDPDVGRATANLALLGEVAEKAGMSVALEFITYNSINTLDGAARMAAATGLASVGLMVDAIHLDRSGARPADLAGIRVPIHVVQLCDASGPRPTSIEDLTRESRTARLYPGQGRLPLADLVAAAPAGCDLEVEAPHPDQLTLPADARARAAATATRHFLASLGERR